MEVATVIRAVAGRALPSADHAGRHAAYDCEWLDVSGHDGPGCADRTPADRHTWKDGSASSNDRVVFNCDLTAFQAVGWVIDVVLEAEDMHGVPNIHAVPDNEAAPPVKNRVKVHNGVLADPDALRREDANTHFQIRFSANVHAVASA